MKVALLVSASLLVAGGVAVATGASMLAGFGSGVWLGVAAARYRGCK